MTVGKLREFMADLINLQGISFRDIKILVSIVENATMRYIRHDKHFCRNENRSSIRPEAVIVIGAVNGVL